MGKQSNKKSNNNFHSINTVDQLVNCAHQGRYENPPWTSLLKTLCTATGSDAALLLIRGPSLFDVSPFWHFSPTSIVSQRIRNLPDGTLYLFEFMSEIENFTGPAAKSLQNADNNLLQHFMLPFDIDHLLGAALPCKDYPANYLFLLRGKNQDEYPYETQDLMRIVLPHLEIALNNHLFQIRQKFSSVIYGDILSKLGVGILILDSMSNVMDRNTEAESILNRGEFAKLSNDRISISSRSEDERFFYKLLGDALKHHKSKMMTEFKGSARFTSETFDIAIKVRTTSLSEWLQFGGPALVIYITDLKTSPKPSPRLISSLFKLTEAEAELAAAVAGAVAEGSSEEEAAAIVSAAEGGYTPCINDICSKI